MDKQKYNRAAKDSSQLQHFVDETCETALSPEVKEQLEELLTNPIIKEGNYIYDDTYDVPVFKWVETIPEDYNDYAFSFNFYSSDEVIMGYWTNGAFLNYIRINSADAIIIHNEVGTASLSPTGVDKIDAEDGTPVTVYGEDENGNLVKGAVSGGGTRLYEHDIVLYRSGSQTYTTHFKYLSLYETQASSFNIIHSQLLLFESGSLHNGSGGFPNIFHIELGSIPPSTKVIYFYCINNSDLTISKLTSTDYVISSDTVRPL